MPWTLLALTLLTLIGVACGLDPSEFDVSMLVAACVAPLGAWIRYAISPRNKRYALPWMTFAGNVAASAVAVAAYLGSMRGECSESTSSWSLALSGFVTGFCGALSTMSTFIGELHALGLESGTRYAAASILSSQILAWAMLVPYGAQFRCWW